MWRAVGLFGWSIADTHHWLTCYGCSPLQVQPAALRAARPAALSPKGAPTRCQALCARHHRHILSCATLTSPRMVLGRVTRRSRHATGAPCRVARRSRHATVARRSRHATVGTYGDRWGPVVWGPVVRAGVRGKECQGGNKRTHLHSLFPGGKQGTK